MAGRVGFWGGEGSKKYGIRRVPYKNRCLSGSKVRISTNQSKGPFFPSLLLYYRTRKFVDLFDQLTWLGMKDRMTNAGLVGSQ